MSPRSDAVEVFADVACPFTHLGLRRFVEHRSSAGREDVRLWVRAWPLEIVNGEPLDAAFIGEEIDDIRRQVAPDVFLGFDQGSFPSTSVPAMTLAALAYDRDLELGERVSLDLRHLLFEQGLDIANDEVLDEVAERHDLHLEPGTLADQSRVSADHAEGVRRGVIGSPHFFTPAGDFFCPSLDVERDARGHLRIHTNPAEFDDFIATCFT